MAALAETGFIRFCHYRYVPPIFAIDLQRGDYTSIIQCTIPVFKGLLPPPYSRNITILLFHLADWHALAKLRMHMESTLEELHNSTINVGKKLQRFQDIPAAAFQTKELPQEVSAHMHRAKHDGALNQSHASGRSNEPQTLRIKRFNLSTYIIHALGDYFRTIQLFGTTDSYTTQIVSTFSL
ncbi:hypothetical protein SERLA73DRAFT_63777 [Serpula lacrymans var. lacrymans S7.3]|uniref:Uncharacterized protein n=1 Tax=Serpula lacrymans var. lacrymans (strain S7.3) TaxID=936435 RepID=F8QD43_SERL3|nr:hypothetical protein SERLA73DRAFT_63777 [Serpula lacrymans var. lacrymans S7.3]